MITKTKKGLSTITTKYQTTIPQDIREMMNIQKGDKIIFEIENGKVYIRKMEPLDTDYLKSISATLEEWNSDEDEEAYHDL